MYIRMYICCNIVLQWMLNTTEKINEFVLNLIQFELPVYIVIRHLVS